MRDQQDYSPQLTEERDYPLLELVYRYDGILSVDQVHRWFFPDATRRRAEIRIKQLSDAGYLQRALEGDKRYRPPEPVVWLGKPGAEALAVWLGVEYKDLDWRNQPKSSRIGHDIALNEFRRKFEQALLQHPRYSLRRWYGQDELMGLFTKPVPYLGMDGKPQVKGVRPDGLVTVSDGTYRMHFAIEYDNDNMDHQHFAREKVSPGVHWMLTDAYRQQIGSVGRFLVVADVSEERFRNMRASVTRVGGGSYFLFVRNEGITVENILTSPIWYLSFSDEPFSLEHYDTPAFQEQLARILTQSNPAVPHLKLLDMP